MVSPLSLFWPVMLIMMCKRTKMSRSAVENVCSKAGGETSLGQVSSQLMRRVSVNRLNITFMRARRGQATDSHNLAERARMEKISERMKMQDLVPGCNKVVGKALVLDEIINYVQSIQRQVEFLSMKLEAVNSGLNRTTEGFLSKYHGATGANVQSQQTPCVSKTSREYDQDTLLEWLHMQAFNGLGGKTGKEPSLL